MNIIIKKKLSIAAVVIGALRVKQAKQLGLLQDLCSLPVGSENLQHPI